MTFLRRLAVLLVLPLALALSACDSGGSGGGDVSLTVVNGHGRPLQGGEVVVTAVDSEAGPDGVAQRHAPSVCTTTTGANGGFTCDLPPGRYVVTVTVPGYNTGSFNIVVDEDGNVTVDLPPLTGDGSIDAQFVDAISHAILTFAHVQCRRQLPDGTYSDFEFEATTDAAGRIQIDDVFLGTAECIVQAGASQIPVIIVIEPDTDGTIPVTPPPAQGAYRVVLRWGQTPADLDAHLTGPDSVSTSDRFHVYYASRSYGRAQLDTDDTSSYGPETITFFPATAGVYRYTVHNYTLRSSTEGGTSIHQSPTRVEVFDASGLVRTYVAPLPTSANHGLISNSWRVFELTVSATGSISISGQNTRPDQPQDGLQYVLANGPGDLGTFLTGTLPAKPASL